MVADQSPCAIVSWIFGLQYRTYPDCLPGISEEVPSR